MRRLPLFRLSIAFPSVKGAHFRSVDFFFLFFGLLFEYGENAQCFWSRRFWSGARAMIFNPLAPLAPNEAPRAFWELDERRITYHLGDDEYVEEETFHARAPRSWPQQCGRLSGPL